ncbi:MAG: NAD+ synthase, partial [Planctomycetes bacterium]|nr:NAD+ synthase [Planctomycetota bacterium]
MKIALAQLNPTVGDLDGNSKLIREAVLSAKDSGAELVICSELIICGYPPKDLLLREGFTTHCDQAVERLASQIPNDIGVLVGHPTHKNTPDSR